MKWAALNSTILTKEHTGNKYMTQYALVFKSNQAFDWTALPPEAVQKTASAWGNWIESMGSAVQSSNAFKFGGKSVSKSGSKDADNLTTGYVVVEAENLAKAEALAKDAPSVGVGQGSIEVYEVLPTQH
ncbi:MAG TPA: YciI family protein [Candidatus Saccharimonadia bacterium]|nr:YciI family protein [Candidatus Saccharimonadia bacterium]